MPRAFLVRHRGDAGADRQEAAPHGDIPEGNIRALSPESVLNSDATQINNPYGHYPGSQDGTSDISDDPFGNAECLGLYSENDGVINPLPYPCQVRSSTIATSSPPGPASMRNEREMGSNRDHGYLDHNSHDLPVESGKYRDKS